MLPILFISFFINAAVLLYLEMTLNVLKRAPCLHACLFENIQEGL